MRSRDSESYFCRGTIEDSAVSLFAFRFWSSVRYEKRRAGEVLEIKGRNRRTITALIVYFCWARCQLARIQIAAIARFRHGSPRSTGIRAKETFDNAIVMAMGLFFRCSVQDSLVRCSLVLIGREDRPRRARGSYSILLGAPYKSNIYSHASLD